LCSEIFEFDITKSPNSDRLKQFMTLATRDPSRAFAVDGMAGLKAPPKTDEGALPCMLAHPRFFTSRDYGFRYAAFRRFHNGVVSRYTWLALRAGIAFMKRLERTKQGSDMFNRNGSTSNPLCRVRVKSNSSPASRERNNFATSRSFEQGSAIAARLASQKGPR
jgi:hypothetical protein